MKNWFICRFAEERKANMKKLITCILIILFLFPAAVLAEEVAVEVVADVIQSEIPTEPVTWEYLATVAGCAMMTMLIVQLLKLPLDKVWKIPTRIIVFVISFIIMLAATFFTKGLTGSTALLTVFHAVIAALPAMGGYELTFAKIEKKE